MKLREFLEAKDPILCPVVQFCMMREPGTYVPVFTADENTDRKYDEYRTFIREHEESEVKNISLMKTRKGLLGVCITLKEQI